MAIPRNIIISRTDSIGDVVLTLPVAAALKQHLPGIQIAFLGKAYTKPVIEACTNIDQFIDLDDFLQEDEILINGQKAEAILHVFPVAKIARKAKQLKIPLRIGTTNRVYHWTTCNKLVKLSRKNSPLHEAQLNLALLKGLGVDADFSIDDIQSMFGLENLHQLKAEHAALLSTNQYNLILHPKSQGSAREWGLSNFIELVKILNPAQYKIFVSGTANERKLLQPLFDEAGDRVTDITGIMTLAEFISFINHCNGLIANSTGPLHIAAALSKDAFGIYPPIRPMHPGRWAPLGKQAKVFVLNKNCEDCRKSGSLCHCMQEIKPGALQGALEQAAASLH